MYAQDPIKIPTFSERKVMRILLDEPKGLYGLQIVERSQGELKRGSVYVLLGRLEEKGFIEVSRTEEGSHPGLPRPHYRLNGLGKRVLNTFDSLGALTAGAR